MERPSPSPPSSTPPSKRSLIPVLMAAMLLLACVAVLSLLTLGFAGVIVAIVICLALVIGLQYVLWGWWLTAYLQRREAAASSSKSLSRSSGNTPAPDPPST